MSRPISPSALKIGYKDLGILRPRAIFRLPNEPNPAAVLFRQLKFSILRQASLMSFDHQVALAGGNSPCLRRGAMSATDLVLVQQRDPESATPGKVIRGWQPRAPLSRQTTTSAASIMIHPFFDERATPPDTWAQSESCILKIVSQGVRSCLSAL
jgi:hypothetical protein